MGPGQTSDVGVIVGRFQVHQLHAAHRDLIQSIYKTHANTLIVLGLSQARVSTRNPLDFVAREQMMRAAFPKAHVLYIEDEPTDTGWSASLDRLVERYASPAQRVTLYGSRDSFLVHYMGKFRTEALEPKIVVSGSELRQTISRSTRGTEDFRAGVIWAAANGHPKVFPTVDVAIYRGLIGQREWLLVRKPHEQQWRFCGGFVHPSDASWEAAARREAVEETGVEVADLHYVDSLKVDDWRYREEDDKIITTLFVGQYLHGPVMPRDDVAEARWTSLSGVRPLVAEHLLLVAALEKKGWLS